MVIDNSNDRSNLIFGRQVDKLALENGITTVYVYLKFNLIFMLLIISGSIDGCVDTCTIHYCYSVLLELKNLQYVQMIDNPCLNCSVGQRQRECQSTWTR